MSLRRGVALVMLGVFWTGCGDPPGNPGRSGNSGVTPSPPPTSAPAPASASAPPTPEDVVAVASTQPVTVLLDGRRAGCENDERRQGSGQISVGNVLSPGTCISEVAAFAESHAMQLLAPLAAWTDNGGDVVNVTMTSLLNVPLAVWILHQNSTNTRELEVEAEVNRAAQLFDTEQCGVEFAATVTDVSKHRFPTQLLEAACSDMPGLKAVGFQAGKVNVYYLRKAAAAQGVRCPDGSSDVILVGAAINDNETLAHELGHATSLGHWQTTPGSPDDNLMVSGGSLRNSLSLGQCFRSNANASSVLNRLPVRTGPTRNCPDTTANESCPALALK